MSSDATPDQRARRAAACRRAQWMMIVDAVVGACLAIYAYYALKIPGLAAVGLFIMAGGIIMAVVFRLIGRRALLGGQGSHQIRGH